MRPLRSTEQKRLHRDWRRRTEGRVALILDNVQTPFNVGSIVRTAASFRVEHLWLAGASITPDHPKSRKTSLGTERLVPWSQCASGADAVAEARQAGFQVVAVELATDAVPLADAELGADVCLVLGHEEHGIAAATLGACDLAAYVPTPGKVGSLNVAVTAAIGLYELRRREWTG